MYNKATFVPSLLLSELYFPCYEVKGVIADAVERAADEGFYGGIEIASISESDDRKRIHDTALNAGLCITQWLSPFTIKNQLDISAANRELRAKTVKMIKESLYFAAECGASNIGLITGTDPGEARRKDAAECLYESLCAICESAESYGRMNILLEPLDRGVHKNGLIGPTSEAVDLVKRVRNSYLNAGISWDAAHVALNGENLEKSLELAKDYIFQIHLSNAVLDRASKDFGDLHMPIGAPGFLNRDRIKQLFSKAKLLGMLDDGKLRVSVEVRTAANANPLDSVKSAGEVLINLQEDLKQ